MTSIDLEEFKRIKLHPVKCPECKLTALVEPTEKVCPVCGGSLPIPDNYER